MTLTRGQVLDLLVAHGIRPSRALGQNFVTDPNTVRRIARLAGIGPGDRVLEIGPGLGSLTLALAETGAAVTAIEADRHLIPVLQAVIGATDVKVVQADVMKIDWSEVLDGDGGWVLVANLPYNIATPLVADLLDQVPAIERMLIMVQREVAERLTATVGQPGYGAVSVKVAYWAESKLAGKVSAAVFHPKPKVESALVDIRRRPVPLVDPSVVSAGALFSLVRSGFATRRKMLRRALSGVVDASTFEAAGISPESRAEELDVEAWGRLAGAVAAAAGTRAAGSEPVETEAEPDLEPDPEPFEPEAEPGREPDPRPVEPETEPAPEPEPEPETDPERQLEPAQLEPEPIPEAPADTRTKGRLRLLGRSGRKRDTLVVVQAPAKLTLSLRVTGVRDDGYHLLDAEMVTVDLADTLEFGPGDGLEIIQDREEDDVPLGPENLVARALALTGRRAAVRLRKRIPAGAGLGGGSADAAAVLRWAGIDDPIQAAALGADVAFCLAGGRARVTGIGEIVEPLSFEEVDGDVYTLLTPPFQVSTAAVYQAWDRMGGPVGERGNDLEPAALEVEPDLATWRDRLGDATGEEPRLAGSGGTWFVPGSHPGQDRLVVRVAR